MMRSLYSGISGLRNHQTRMDVIGNNIANVNTAGYKTSRVIFQDIFSQTSSGGMANTEPIGGILGGVNPLQIGLGIRLSSIDVMHTRSAFQRTDNPFDMMINGDGFFVVGERHVIIDEDDNDIESWAKLYTRAGNFKLDDMGYLTTSDGMYVLGYASEVIFTPSTGTGTAADPFTPPTITLGAMGTELTRIRLRFDVDTKFFEPDGTTEVDIDDVLDAFKLPMDLLGFSVGPDGSISVMLNNEKQTVGRLAIAMFSNPGGLEKAGNSFYRATDPSGNAVLTVPTMDGSGEIIGGGLEMSNVDLATEFTDMIVTQRGFQANSRIITVSDTMLEELINLKR